MAEFLLEVYSEEIPARMQARAAEDLLRQMSDGLKAAGLAFASARAFVTPRRLALVVDGLPQAQPDVKEEKKGPRVGSPLQAVDGFLKSAGLASPDQCEKRDTAKGEFYFAVIEKKGAKTAAILPQVILAALAALPWPKSMRWGGNTQRWVRPIHSIVALFDGVALEGAFELGPDRVTFGNRTRGHRFLAPGEIAVAGFADYQAKLCAAKVILDPAERRAAIWAQAEAAAAAQGATVKTDEGLLDEVTGLVEWPVVLAGRIDEAFMSVPHEVLTTSMRVNQKYFALLGKDGNLAPRFLVTANIEAADGGSAIIHGNERVLRARLSDAKFFWDHDLKYSLAERVPALDAVTYHAKLGSVGAKVRRVKALARELAKFIPGCEASLANQAAGLAKADLVSGMVGEFPELQGIMGRYYARAENLPRQVADAIAEHYRPLGPGDTCPTAAVSVAVALADKIDTLAGFFAIDEKPTGSKDPFALRRAALGVIRLILENGLRLKLRDIIIAAHGGYQAAGDGLVQATPAAVAADLMEFFADRLKVVLRERGVRHDFISAVFAPGGEDDLTRMLARVNSLKSLIDSEEGTNLLAGYRRATNILRIEEKKDGRAYAEAPDPNWLQAAEERALHDALANMHRSASDAVAGEDFAAAMAALAGLREPVDAFFDKVTVNAGEKELRDNRLRLLNSIRTSFSLVADFSKIEG
jgi:glycyl-tRNA synthetase beta chain